MFASKPQTGAVMLPGVVRPAVMPLSPYAAVVQQTDTGQQSSFPQVVRNASNFAGYVDAVCPH